MAVGARPGAVEISLLATGVCSRAGLRAVLSGTVESGGRRWMRKYEALVIVDPRLEEGDIQKAIDRFSGAVTESGGGSVEIDRWGVRRFAYEIDHQREGYYFVAAFDAPVEAIERLERTLQIADEFIRGKIVRPE